ncbi:uncharacterized protein KD926_005073 [Aspergillus affinis]|uniref:uncharacterized protein n=1 Tax=Aspergillus affinis TaxID=1070780 RepID=UPI0022FE1CF9|nr:uncharacterized protein KD926_005073 [Aspergillus affinis]KAI9042743.1 hypothetical protein KD926_005073 [Aspergillus affinis]
MPVTRPPFIIHFIQVASSAFFETACIPITTHALLGIPRFKPIMMDRIDFELCLDVDQHEPAPRQPDNANVTGTDANDQQEPPIIRHRRTRTFSEIEADSTYRSGHDANNPPKRPKILGFGDDVPLQQEEYNGETTSEYQRPTNVVSSIFPYHDDDISIMMSPFHTTMRSHGSENTSVPMAVDNAPGHGTPYSELETPRSSLSSMYRSYPTESNMTIFSSTETGPSNRFIIYEDTDDAMDIATSHIEFSLTWPSSYVSRAEDNKENYEGDEDADDEADTPNARGIASTAPGSSSAMDPVRSIQDDEHELEHNPDYVHTEETLMNSYHNQSLRRPWSLGTEDAFLLPASPRHSHLSVSDDFDADDEADLDIILTNSGYGSSVNTHYQDEMGRFYRPFPTLADAPELSTTIYSPLTEIPSMSPICPEVVTQGPRRPMRTRVRFPVL